MEFPHHFAAEKIKERYMSVFISWAGADREVKNVIAEKLRQEKIDYFDSDEHCVSNFSEECIANIRRSSVFIVIVSKASMDPHSYVRNEIIEARRMENDGALNILVYKITDEPYNEFFSFNLNHISDANHVARIQRGGSIGGIDILIKRTKHLLALREAGTPEKPLDVLYPRLIAAPVSIGAYLGYFVDRSRDGVLDELKAAFERSNTVILSELFGFGKKSVIRKFATSGDYKTALELEGMHMTLSEFFRAGLKFSNVSEAAFKSDDTRAVIRRKFELLSRLDEKHIIIISDVDVESEPDAELINLLRTLKCHVAIITQSAASEYRDFMPVINVGRMESEYLTELFFHYFDRGGSFDRAELAPTLLDFFEDIGGHTKTVELAASVLSKEMVMDADEVKRILTATESGRSLVDRIAAKLGSLIDVENFGDEEKNTLLILSLMAMPTISLSALMDIGRAADFDPRPALKALAEHRWITINTSAGTVYIEPIIARLCMAKLEPDFEIITVCFSKLTESYSTIAAKNRATAISILAKIERFFSLTGNGALAELAGVMRTLSGTYSPLVDEKIESFVSWFGGFKERFDETSERDVLTARLAAWVLCYAVPMIETANRLPSIMNFSITTSSAASNVTSDALGKLSALQFEPLIYDYSELAVDEEEEYNAVTDIYTRFVMSFNEKDYEEMNNVILELIDLMASPEIAEDKSSASVALMIAKIFANSCSTTGAYRTGIAVLEKLIPIDFGAYVEHQLLMAYVKLLIESGDTSASASTVMETAEEMLSDIKAEGDIPEDELLGIVREHTALYAVALAVEGDTDEALRRFDELMRMGAQGVVFYALDAAKEIVDRLLYEKRKSDAVDMIAKYRDFFIDSEEDGTLAEYYKEEARSCLALLEFSKEMDREEFTAGGIVENESYYQKYSREKKNGMFKMMAYNKVADGVKRFSFADIRNEDFKAHADRLRARAESGESKLRLAPEAFALVSEAGFRTLGYRHHYVQYVGAAAMLDGKIAEILNGEGKTYTVALTAFVESLYSDKVFVFDESRYLTERNYKWMRGIYSLLGLDVVHVSSKNQYTFSIDTDRPTVFYSSLAAFGFSMNSRDLASPVKRGILSGAAAIVDEADTILVEMASTSIQATNPTASPKRRELCRAVYSIAERIFGNRSYYNVKNGYPQLTDEVKEIIEETLSKEYDDVHSSDDLATAEKLLKKALYSLSLERGRDYFVINDRLYVENSRTGELTEIESETGYFIARRDGVGVKDYESKLTSQTLIANHCYVYGLLKRFGAISGTSATASSFKKEFKDIYGLEVISIPPAKPIKRKDMTVTLFISREMKDAAIIDLVEERYAIGQPILLIAKNIRESLAYSRLLNEHGIPHKLLNAANSESSPETLAGAGEFGSVLVATQIANRGVDIKLGGDPRGKRSLSFASVATIFPKSMKFSTRSRRKV